MRRNDLHTAGGNCEVCSARCKRSSIDWQSTLKCVLHKELAVGDSNVDGLLHTLPVMHRFASLPGGRGLRAALDCTNQSAHTDLKAPTVIPPSLLQVKMRCHRESCAQHRHSRDMLPCTVLRTYVMMCMSDIYT